MLRTWTFSGTGVTSATARGHLHGRMENPLTTAMLSGSLGLDVLDPTTFAVSEALEVRDDPALPSPPVSAVSARLF